MKWLKLPALISLNINVILILINFSPIVGVLFSMLFNTEIVFSIVFCTLIIWSFFSAIIFMIYYYPRKWEREFIEKADAPLWKELSDEEKKSLSEKKPMSVKALAICIAVIIVVMILGCNLCKDETICMIIILFSILCCIAAMYKYTDSNIWADIDDTVVYQELTVHHYITKKHLPTRKRLYYYAKSYSDIYQKDLHNVNVERYLVCYHSSGKYIFCSMTNIINPEKVMIVKYKGRFRIIVR